MEHRHMRLFELATPLNFELSDQIDGSNGFELGDAEFEPHSMYEGECVTAWTVGMEGIDLDNIGNEVQDWCNWSGIFRDEDLRCATTVWVLLAGHEGKPYLFELDEFTRREQCWIVEALNASLAHNDAA